MYIRTNQSIVIHRQQITDQIAGFWNQISEAWRSVWGQHIHHGYYENEIEISPQEAQEKLIIKLIEQLQMPADAVILDVGCGMGGSSLHLAKHHQAKVTGITLSQKQVNIAQQQARDLNINNVRFKIEDALSLASIPDQSIDIVWSLESCEQFFDKNLFIQNAYRVLKPGGKLMLATWCSSQDDFSGLLAKKYRKLCLAFDLPYMPSINHYLSLLNQNHFSLNYSADWSTHVRKSWNIGLTLINAYSFFKILKMGGWRGFRFAKQIKLMRDAFYEGWVRYGVFVAIKK